MRIECSRNRHAGNGYYCYWIGADAEPSGEEIIQTARKSDNRLNDDDDYLIVSFAEADASDTNTDQDLSNYQYLREEYAHVYAVEIQPR